MSLLFVVKIIYDSNGKLISYKSFTWPQYYQNSIFSLKFHNYLNAVIPKTEKQKKNKQWKTKKFW